MKYEWDFYGRNYDSTTDNNIINHTYNAPGNFNIKVRATDNDGASELEISNQRLKSMAFSNGVKGSLKVRKKSVKSLVYIMTVFMLIIFASCSNSKNYDLSTDPTSENVLDTTSTGDSTAAIFSFTTFGITVNKTIYLEKVGSDNDEITLAIKIKGGTNVFGAVLEITYDSEKINYETSAVGNYLGEASDILFFPILDNGQEGRLHIAVDKKGNVPGTYGDGTLATIVLKALTKQANTAIKFDVTISNLMSATTNNPISGITWLGGTLTYQ